MQVGNTFKMFASSQKASFASKHIVVKWDALKTHSG